MLSNVLAILHQQQQHKIFLVVYNFSLFLFFWGVSFYDVCLRNKIKDTKLISLRASAVSYIQIVLIQFLFQFFFFFIIWHIVFCFTHVFSSYCCPYTLWRLDYVEFFTFSVFSFLFKKVLSRIYYCIFSWFHS